LSKVDSRRRAFLRGALLTRAGRAAEAVRQQPLGPPPPWHQGLALADYCPGCPHPCTDTCEPGIIRLHPKDHEWAGLPYLDFSHSGCTFCQACVVACPIDIEVTADTRPVIGTAQLNRNTCIAWDDVICMSCSGRCDYRVAACPVNALHIPA